MYNIWKNDIKAPILLYDVALIRYYESNNEIWKCQNQTKQGKGQKEDKWGFQIEFTFEGYYNISIQLIYLLWSWENRG